MRTGTIPISNQYGITVNVQYRLDQATNNFILVANPEFTRDDIDRAMQDMPNLIRACILVNETEKDAEDTAKNAIPNHSTACDRSICGLSGGR